MKIRHAFQHRPRAAAAMIAVAGLLIFAGASASAKALGASTAGAVVAYFALIVFTREALSLWRRAPKDLAPTAHTPEPTEPREAFDPDKTVPLLDPDKTVRLSPRPDSDRPFRQPRDARQSR
jgi:hypothetical protein